MPASARPGQVAVVEEVLLAEPRLDPGVEAGAEPGRRRRRPRHRPGQLAGERLGVVAEPAERGGGQAARQGYGDVGAAVAARLGEQPVELGVPLGDPGGLDHVEPVVRRGRGRPRGPGAAASIRSAASRPVPVAGHGRDGSTAA